MTNRIKISFHGSLNDFLSKEKSNSTISIELGENSSVKDVIENQGVPHPEVLYIMVNNSSADFTYNIKDGDNIEAYPVTAPENIVELKQPTVKIYPEPRFILDVHLGTLARKLRLLGFDTLYKNEMDDPEIADIAASENRVVLTRDIGLLMRSKVEYGYWIRSQNTDEQLREVFKRFKLKAKIQPFSLCISCNGKIQLVEKEKIKDKLEPDTYAYYNEFYQCNSCKKVYWKVSHYPKLMKVVESM